MSAHTYETVMGQLRAWGSLKLLRPTVFQERLRGLSRELKTDHVLAQQLWFTGNADAMLVASSAFDPGELSEDGVARMVEQLAHPKVVDDLVSNTLVRTPFARSLRGRWLDSIRPTPRRAGWILLTHEVATGSVAAAELDSILVKVEAEVRTAPRPIQEAMLGCLVEIALRDPTLRARCLGLGRSPVSSQRPRRSRALTSLYGPIRMGASASCAG